MASKISRYNRKLADSQGQDNGGGDKEGRGGGRAGVGGGESTGLLAAALREQGSGPALPRSPLPRPVPTPSQHGEDVHLPDAPPAHGQNF